VTTPHGTAEAGKAVWALGNTSCRNCHGGDGEGAFGPALAGRKLPYERFRNYVRNPIGRMPGYVESELTDQEMADLVAYFDTLPPVAKPGPWRFPLPEGAPRGQQLAVATIGCAQCHGVTLETPRHGAAEVTGDWEWFKRQVYEHTTAQREQWSQLDPQMPRTTPMAAGPPGRNRIRMGNYARARLPESTLKEIWDWAIDLGRLAPLVGRVTPGAATANGTTYTVDVTNAGVKNKGITVEDITVSLALPAGAKVVSATGAGYQGVRHDEEAKSEVAVWRVPSMVATDRQAFTITLSPAATALRGTIRWARPAVKADDDVAFAMAGPGRGGV
ncbi:MAG: c-type cytochrome, partial [Chloroflexota bacterium]|nr:c-type cytochrome [Chloroflexota bacterium]